MKVVVVVEDSLPSCYVGKQHTTQLWQLITRSGGWNEQGGHPLVPKFCHVVRGFRPHSVQWAPPIVTLLGLSLPQATGQSLL